MVSNQFHQNNICLNATLYITVPDDTEEDDMEFIIYDTLDHIESSVDDVTIQVYCDKAELNEV